MVWWMLALRLSGLGFYISACIVGGILLGVWMDRTFDTGIIFLLAGLALGLVSAFYGTYRMVTPLFNDSTSPPDRGRQE